MSTTPTTHTTIAQSVLRPGQLSLLPPAVVVTPAGEWCQRWTGGAHSWRHRSEGGFDSRRYDVAPVSHAAAKQFVVDHHYAHSYVAARLEYGLWAAQGLVGVAVLSVPTNVAVLSNVFPQLQPYYEALCLGRFVLADSVAANGETWFLARAFRLAAAAGVAGVVSFSDPVPRVAADGTVNFPGHVGLVYQAANAVYLGRTTASTKTVLADGTVFDDRARSKLLRGERGHRYVEDRLRQLGAPARRGDPRAWLPTALDAIGARRVRHGGQHRFAFTLQRRVTVAGTPGRYPKRPDRD